MVTEEDKDSSSEHTIACRDNHIIKWYTRNLYNIVNQCYPNKYKRSIVP